MNYAVLVAFLLASTGCSWSIHKERRRLIRNESTSVDNSTVCLDRVRVNSSMWGIWIDGRNAEGGKNAYGKDYTHIMKLAVARVYRMVRHDPRPISVDIFMEFMQLLHSSWRIYKNPVHTEVKDCHEAALPQEHRQAIMKNIIVMDEHYEQFNLVNETEENHTEALTLEDKYRAALTRLFDLYHGKLQEGKDGVQALGWLMQNLAFLHPLSDQNGRSRLMILQYELRRLGLGCGTMMYNNNKNIYFDTLEIYTEKIKDGMKAYEMAQRTQFEENPWSNLDYRKMFKVKFHNFFLIEGALQLCWTALCHAKEGCKGTTPLLLDEQLN